MVSMPDSSEHAHMIKSLLRLNSLFSAIVNMLSITTTIITIHLLLVLLLLDYTVS
jgi:hypothetical protein